MSETKLVNSSKNNSVRIICFTAMITALAFAAVAFGRVPAVLFLKYEPKDVILLLGALLFGPTVAFASVVICCVVEMLTISSTGGWGLLMNLISSLAFVLIPLLPWEKKRNMRSLILGLLYSSLAMTALMLLWNYIVTPIFLNKARAEVVPLLSSAILPFNLIKAAINSGLVLLLYKPISEALKGMLPNNRTIKSTEAVSAKRRIVYYIIGAFLVLTGSLCIYFFQQM